MICMIYLITLIPEQAHQGNQENQGSDYSHARGSASRAFVSIRST